MNNRRAFNPLDRTVMRTPARERWRYTKHALERFIQRFTRPVRGGIPREQSVSALLALARNAPYVISPASTSGGSITQDRRVHAVLDDTYGLVRFVSVPDETRIKTRLIITVFDPSQFVPELEHEDWFKNIGKHQENEAVQKEKARAQALATPPQVNVSDLMSNRDQA